MRDMPSAGSSRVFDVDDVVSALERIISEHTRTVRIRGEVVNLRSGRDGRVHWFRLEDPREGHDARLDCMAFATDVADGCVLADGRVVEAVARPEFSRRDGRLQVRLHRIQPAGEGELIAMLVERRRRLAAEGLFDPSRKQALPFVPRGVGLVTAAGGAARADVLRRIDARFPLPVVVVHAAMQGSACAREVVAALAALDSDPRVDVILIARGGGSLQDLLPFSDEAVVRAIGAAATPVVTGIGHEPDVTLACLAADARAATPTAAVDLLVPDGALLREDLGAAARRLSAGARRSVAASARHLGMIASRPGLARPHEAVVRGRREALAVAARRLGPAARAVVAHRARDLAVVGARPDRAARGAVSSADGRLAVFGARLAAGDPTRPLGAGFALVRDSAGRAVVTAAAAAAAGRVTLEFGDGLVGARVEEDAGG
jgi:exodeoxyribonuclease VII large subunit